MSPQIEMVDKSGTMPTPEDVDEAIHAISTTMLGGITDVPPSLAVSLPVIHRCLKVAKIVIDKMDMEKKT